MMNSTRRIEVDQITFQKYQFHVYSYDDYRGNLGERLVRKIEFRDPEDKSKPRNSDIEIVQKNLSLLNVEEIAAEFNRIMQESQAVRIKFTDFGSNHQIEKTFKATTISMYGGDNPFLFILGVTVDRSNI